MKKYLIGLFAVVAVLTACEKKIDPVDTYYVTVDYRNSGPKFVTSDVTVNPKDSIYFDFTINSRDDMSYVEIQKNGVRVDTFRLNGSASKTSFSLVKGYRIDSAAGDYSYRVLARNDRAVFMGDGGKQFKVTVKPDFDYFLGRTMLVPDTIPKINNCYMAAQTGTLYNYSNGAANSASIDFGLYYDTTGAASASTTDDLRFCVYSLSAPQTQLSYYDISSFTKNVTIMKKATSPAWNTLTSGGALRTAGITNLSSGTSTKITQLVAGNLVFFKTAAGKVGCMQVIFVNGSSPAKDSYMQVEIKIER